MMFGTVLIFLMLGLGGAVIYLGNQQHRTELTAAWFLTAAVTMALIFH